MYYVYGRTQGVLAYSLIKMLKSDEQCNFLNSYVFTFTLDTQISNFDTSFMVLSCLSVQNLEWNRLLGCEILLPMFCAVPMGDPWHSYVGSTSVLPDIDIS